MSTFFDNKGLRKPKAKLVFEIKPLRVEKFLAIGKNKNRVENLKKIVRDFIQNDMNSKSRDEKIKEVISEETLRKLKELNVLYHEKYVGKKSKILFSVDCYQKKKKCYKMAVYFFTSYDIVLNPVISAKESSKMLSDKVELRDYAELEDCDVFSHNPVYFKDKNSHVCFEVYNNKQIEEFRLDLSKIEIDKEDIFDDSYIQKCSALEYDRIQELKNSKESKRSHFVFDIDKNKGRTVLTKTLDIYGKVEVQHLYLMESKMSDEKLRQLNFGVYDAFITSMNKYVNLVVMENMIFGERVKDYFLIESKVDNLFLKKIKEVSGLLK